MDDLLKRIAVLDDEIASVNVQENGLAAMRKDLECERERLAQKAANEMIEFGCTSSDLEGLRWSIRNTPQKVIITDEALIPPKFFRERVTKSVNKTLLKSALSNGAIIQGAELSNGGVTLVCKAI